MMRTTRTRIGGNVDVQRLGAALSRPGMDTRVWTSIAFAKADSHYDAEYGVFVDVVLHPSGQEMTARVPAQYAGTHFGLYAKIYQFDELVIVIPNGDPAEGAVVASRLWGKADKPPTEIADDPEEVMLIVQEGKSLRLKTTGAGKVEIDSVEKISLQCDHVMLGDRDATEQVVLGTTYRDKEGTCNGTLKEKFTAIGAAFDSLKTSMITFESTFQIATKAVLIPPAGIAMAAAVTAWKTAFNLACGDGKTAADAASAAVDTFESSAPDYLSEVSKTK